MNRQGVVNVRLPNITASLYVDFIVRTGRTCLSKRERPPSLSGGLYVFSDAEAHLPLDLLLQPGRGKVPGGIFLCHTTQRGMHW